MNATRDIWTNTDERVFLDGLGQWGVRRRDRATLLKNYLAAARMRKRWGQVYRVGAVSYAKHLLKVEERRV